MSLLGRPRSSGWDTHWMDPPPGPTSQSARARDVHEPVRLGRVLAVDVRIQHKRGDEVVDPELEVVVHAHVELGHEHRPLDHFGVARVTRLGSLRLRGGGRRRDIDRSIHHTSFFGQFLPNTTHVTHETNSQEEEDE